jgi:hypothetical protein
MRQGGPGLSQAVLAEDARIGRCPMRMPDSNALLPSKNKKKSKFLATGSFD